MASMIYYSCYIILYVLEMKLSKKQHTFRMAWIRGCRVYLIKLIYIVW